MARMNVGGPALQVTGLVEGMDPGRFDHRLYVGHVGAGEGDHLALRAPDLPFRRVEGLGRTPDALGDARALRDLVAEMRRFRPHVVHTHTAKAGVLGRTAALLCRVPTTVHSFHGHLLHGYFNPPVTAAVTAVERTLARRTSRLLAVGAQVRDDLLAAGVGRPAQYLVVPPGIAIPSPPDRGVARAALGLGDHQVVVSFVARLTAVKRPDRFADVARRVAAARQDVVFLVCGEGELLDELRAATAGVDRVRFLGWRSDVEAVHAASDLTVLTSDNEGMPVSLIEASMCGVAAVATDVGSVAEVVRHGETGLVVPAEVDALTRAVLRLVDDEEPRRRMGRAAAVHAHRCFSRDRLVSDMERLYEELAGTTPGRGSALGSTDK